MGTLITNAQEGTILLRTAGHMQNVPESELSSYGLFACSAALANWHQAEDGSFVLEERTLIRPDLRGPERTKGIDILKILLAYENGLVGGEPMILRDEQKEGHEKYIVSDRDSNLWKAIDAAQQRRAQKPSVTGLGAGGYEGKAQPGNGPQPGNELQH